MRKTNRKAEMKIINVRVTKKIHTSMMREAKHKGITLAQVVRNAIESVHREEAPL